MPNPAARECCSFCGIDRAHAALLFRGKIGGSPPLICGDCIAEGAAHITAERECPGYIDAVVEAQRAELAKRWRDAHSGSGSVPL
jgi:hypothetical protein